MKSIIFWSLAKEGKDTFVKIEKGIVALLEKKTTEGHNLALDINGEIHSLAALKDSRNTVVEAKSEYNNLILTSILNGKKTIITIVEIARVKNNVKVIKKALAEDFVSTEIGKKIYADAQKAEKQTKENMKKTAKHIIYKSELESIEDIKKYLIRDFGDEVDEIVDINDSNALYEYAQQDNKDWFDAEKMNLPREKLEIVAIASLGLWNGRKTAYKEFGSISISDIMDTLFSSDSINEVEFYVEDNDLKAAMHHHDGTNYVVYREVTNKPAWERLKRKLYNQEKVTQAEISRCTRSLRHYVDEVYGW